MNERTVTWNGGVQEEAVDILSRGSGIIVSPTKVGYIIMATDIGGLERKFDAKERNRQKPAVVLCSSLEQLRELAVLNDEIDAFYVRHWENDVLLGCILPWQDSAREALPDDGTRQLVMDQRNTSCVVIKFGTPAELIAQRLWNDHRKLAFASSANPSGSGNRGVVAGIGTRIGEHADLIIDGDAYVRSIQPNEGGTRYEQGVMVAMVDAEYQT